MENNLSDANYSGETDVNNTYEEYIKDFSTGNLDFESAKVDYDVVYTTETTETISDDQEDIAEKVEG